MKATRIEDALDEARPRRSYFCVKCGGKLIPHGRGKVGHWQHQHRPGEPCLARRLGYARAQTSS